MDLAVGVVVGNPRAGSRTLRAAKAVASAFAENGEPDLVVDLAEYSSELLDWGSATCAGLVEQVARQDVVVFASPTYKATYTGLLKVFLDRFGAGSLSGLVALPVMVGGSPDHSLAVELHLKPLLSELGASCPTRGLFLLEGEVGDSSQPPPAALQDWLSTAERQVMAVAKAARAVGGRAE